MIYALVPSTDACRQLRGTRESFAVRTGRKLHVSNSVRRRRPVVGSRVNRTISISRLVGRRAGGTAIRP